MRIYFISILLALFFISCNDEKTKTVVESKAENPLGLCDNEIELLRSEADEEIIFDFEQCMDCMRDTGGCNMFDFIEQQKSIDLCDLNLNFSSVFELGNNDTIKTNLYAVKNCYDNYCALPMIEEVLINSNHQILVEGEYISSKGNLKYDLAKKLDYDCQEYGNLKNGKLFYLLQWDEGVDVSFKKYVFKSIIQAYLIRANKLSQNNFKSDLCALNKVKLDSIKDEFSFNLLLQTCVYVVPLEEY